MIHRVAVTIVAVILCIIIYKLPRVVVDNDSLETNVSEETVTPDHNFEISAEDSIRIHNYFDAIYVNGINEKSTIFADSLANLYLAYNQLDSAEKYGRLILSRGDGLENYRLAGEIFFKAFGFSQVQEEAKKFSELAGNCFNVLLKANPDDPDTRAKLAMTLVSSASPMQGINLLRDVLKDYPDNQTALYSLGVLSMQSGQYDKAVNRFEKLIELNPQNVQALFYLGVSQFELGNSKEAAEIFSQVKEIDNDPAIILAADRYLEDINEF